MMGFLDKRFKQRKEEKSLFFTVPFVFDESFVAFLSELNGKDTKYKIRRVYNSLSVTAVGKSGFEHGKAVPPNSSAVEIVSDLKPYVEALKKENIDFVYTMNSVATVPKIEFQKRLPRTHRILQELQECGVKYITIGNQMLSEYVKSVFPDFIVGASTMMDVTSVTKAAYLAEYLNIKYVIPSTDLNKDFDFIESFRALLPDV